MSISAKITDISKLESVNTENPPKRILLIKTSSLGDIIHSFPAFVLLAKSFPAAKIDWLINKNIAQILDYMEGYVNNVLIFDRKAFRPKTFVTETKKLAKVVRGVKYDCIIDMQGLIRSALVCFLAKSSIKAGFRHPREGLSSFFYNKKIEIPNNIIHAIEKNTSLVSSIIGIKHIVPDFKIPAIDKYKNVAEEKLLEFSIDIRKEDYIVIAPGGRWESKRWPARFYSEVIDKISKASKKTKFVVIGSADEEFIVDELLSECNSQKVISLVNKTNMIELVETLRKAKAVITNDSGPMHIAAAMRTPVFALFGPTDPERTGPYWQNSRVYQNTAGCIKCFKRKCEKETQFCQNDIKPETVVNDVIDILKGSEKGA